VLVAFALTLPAGCATAAWPRAMVVSQITAPATTRGDWIESYDAALASIAAIMTRDLALPQPDATVHFHADRDAFRQALEATGYDPAFARETADTLTAVSGHERVVVNAAALEEQPWPIRIALLAHELAHTIQYRWAGGMRGTSDQWLREGFAEWVEVEALVRLGFTTRPEARRVVLSRLRAAGADRLPRLADVVTFPQWVAVVSRSNQEAVYGHAMLATEFLIERTSVTAAVSYFTRFASSDDRLANFERAFGEPLARFEDAWLERQAMLLR
jgi:hypothetical protein